MYTAATQNPVESRTSEASQHAHAPVHTQVSVQHQTGAMHVPAKPRYTPRSARHELVVAAAAGGAAGMVSGVVSRGLHGLRAAGGRKEGAALAAVLSMGAIALVGEAGAVAAAVFGGDGGGGSCGGWAGAGRSAMVVWRRSAASAGRDTFGRRGVRHVCAVLLFAAAARGGARARARDVAGVAGVLGVAGGECGEEMGRGGWRLARFEGWLLGGEGARLLERMVAVVEAVRADVLRGGGGAGGRVVGAGVGEERMGVAGGALENSKAGDGGNGGCGELGGGARAAVATAVAEVVFA